MDFQLRLQTVGLANRLEPRMVLTNRMCLSEYITGTQLYTKLYTVRWLIYLSHPHSSSALFSISR